MQTQIALCAKIANMHYCEYVHLLSAIYYDQSSQIKADKCKMIVIFDTLPDEQNKETKIKILDTGDILILSNLQKPWMIVC